MKDIKSKILENANMFESSDNTVRMYMGPWPEKNWEGGYIATDSKTAAEYRKYQESQIKKNMGTCPSKADPKDLLKGVTNISGESRNAYNIRVVFDKKHDSAKWGNTLASIVFVDDDMSYEAYEKLSQKYPNNRYYIIGGEVRKNTFYMALS